MHDDTQVARVHQMTQALGDGMFPVRWVQDLGYGYGYPIFNFYAPFPYYFGSIFAFVTSDVLLATKIAFITAIVLSAGTMYCFMRVFFPRTAAATAAVIYLYFPYHAVNIYIRGNLNEVFAYAFLPLVMLGFFKLYYLKPSASRLRNLQWILVTAVSCVLVVTSHNLTALMLGILLFALFIILIVFSNQKKQFLISMVSVGAITAGASAFYWVPALLEMQYTNVLSQVGGTADFRDHFVCIPQLWNSMWGFGGSGPGCVDGMSFKLGKLNIIATIGAFIGIGYLLIRQTKQKFVLLQAALFGLLVVSIFMSTSYSSVIWETVPVLEFLQFPWRFLNFVALCMSAVIGLLTYYIAQVFNKYIAAVVAIVLIIGTIVLNGKLFAPQIYYHDRDAAYYSSNEYIRYDASSLTDEYMPQGFAKPGSAEDIPTNTIEVVAGQAEIRNVVHKTGYVSAHIDASTESTIHLNIAYFPAWMLYGNGEEISYQVNDRGMQVTLAQGQSVIEAKFVQTPLQKTANAVSVVTLIIILVITMRYKRYKK